MNTVSVVMATYNGAQFLEDQLASLAAQTHLPSELIISDDGSTDETLDVAEAFRASAPFPVRIARNPARLGYADNFLQAAQHATGDFIAFCDQDDVWAAEKLQAAVEGLARAQACLHVHDAQLIDSEGRTIGAFRQGPGKPVVHEPLELAPWGVFYGFSMVFRRDLLRLIDPALRGGHTFEFEGPLSHDLWVYFLASSLGRVVVDDRPLAAYRQHRANQTPHIGSGLRAWLHLCGVPAYPKLRRDEIAKHRAKLMSGLRDTADEEWLRVAADRACQYWLGISSYERERLRIYAPDGLHRIFACLKLAWRGGYRPFRSGGLGWKLFLKDLLFVGLAGDRIKAWAG